jgi:hypothetical protein
MYFFFVINRFLDSLWSFNIFINSINTSIPFEGENINLTTKGYLRIFKLAFL